MMKGRDATIGFKDEVKPELFWKMLEEQNKEWRQRLWF
jgi:hypothetical protein